MKYIKGRFDCTSYKFTWTNFETNKNPLFDKHDDSKEWDEFESCATIKCRYCWDTLIVSPPQRIFEVKISVNFIFTLNLLNKEWKWKIVLVFNFGWYPKIRSSCFNMVYFNLATYCVSYLHTMPFCRNQIPY